MLHLWYKKTSNSNIYKLSSVVNLFKRIHRWQYQLKQNEYFNHLKSKCLFLLFIISIFYFSECHNRIYNSLNGPFHLNLDEFITHWKIYSGNLSIERSLLSGLISFDKEYLQIEIGEDKIDDNPLNIYGVYYRHPKYEKLLYTFNPIKEQSIANLPIQLLIKLPTNLRSYFHKRLPYHFELFNTNTLKCIAQQINISPNFENSMHIKLIEKIYDQNATDFNMKVITKCGILLGYFYDCQAETVFTLSSNIPNKFTSFAAAFDASSSYSPNMTYCFGSLLLLCCFKLIIEIFIDLFQYLWYISIRPKLIISLDLQDTLNKFNINSIQIFDYLLMSTLNENNYYNQLFLVREQYLIIFKVNLNERDPNVLRQFYTTIPFVIIDIDSIIEINSDYISILDGCYGKKISLPKIDNNNNNDKANWLHERLMDCSANYRQCYESVRVCRQQDAIRAQEEERRSRLAVLIKEEEEIQRINYENDFERVWNHSSSPRLIAQFRLDGPQMMNIQLSKTTCVVCLETIRSGDSYSQWPCPAEHIFHYDCMLNVLRRQNRCPLCRHTVEEANVLSIT